MPNDSAVATARVPAVAASRGFYVVGIGASAGGLAALRTLFSNVTDAPGVAFVVVTHLSPEHESHLDELLRSYTHLPVRRVEGAMTLERNHVYVIPPNANLDSIDTHLRLSPLERERTERAPIDHFFRSLAATHDGSSVAVVLTGAGSDGALGIRLVKECGGLTIAQDPDEAEFDGMPRSAIATGLVDLVLPVRKIAAEVLAFCSTRPAVRIPDGDDAVSEDDEILLQRILDTVRARTGKDLAMFTHATALRRIRRRMRLCRVETLPAYLDALERRENEPHELMRDMLLAVTEFFKSPEVFSAIAKHVLPTIFRSKTNRDRVRVWSIGCSTGEEAYSLAMLLLEHADHVPVRPQLQVFATDLRDELLVAARTGIYPQEVGATISAERRVRFFRHELGQLAVRREVRDVVVFAAHSLFKDPPYSRLDLIMSRNLLGELQPEMRHAVIRLFHYALEPNGFFITDADYDLPERELFEKVDGRAGVYRRLDGVRAQLGIPAARTLMTLPTEPQTGEANGSARASFSHVDFAALHRHAVAPYVPASVLVDSEGRVVNYSARAREYIRIPGGELTHHLTRLVGDPLRSRLEVALRSVSRNGVPWRSEPVSVHTETGPHRIVLRAEPVAESHLTLVVFEELRSVDAGARAKDNEPADLIAHLEEQLDAANRHIRAMLVDNAGTDDVAAEAARRAGELAAILKPLEASKEELQAVNEELTTLDELNRRRLEDLAQLSIDLEHLLESTGVATLFLDIALNVVRFTPQAAELFHVRKADVGRPLGELSHEFEFPELIDDAARVVRHVAPFDREVRARDGRWFLLRMLPYRGVGRELEGVVVTLVDISKRKKTEQLLVEGDRRKDEFLALLAHELRNPLAPISAGVEVLKRASHDPKIVAQVTQTIDRQTKQLIRLVDDLLEISRVSGGRLRLRRSQVQVMDVVRDAVAAARPLIEREMHTLTVADMAEPLTVDADPARVTQVIVNLLSNAARYTARGGEIAISATRDGGDAVIRVRDNGIGMSANQLPHVFDMFYQGEDNPRVSRNAGLGIGLTLAKSLVELHGGTVTATSAGLNAGSEFTVRLPLVERHEAQAPKEARSIAELSGHRVLIVDDNVDAAQTLGMMMEALGKNEVRTAPSGAAALEAGAELRPDIVLLDLKMPGMDGYEVARRIRRESWGGNLLLVALTGWAQDEHKQRTREAGFDRHLTKPADRAAIEAVLCERPGVA